MAEVEGTDDEEVEDAGTGRVVRDESDVELERSCEEADENDEVGGGGRVVWISLLEEMVAEKIDGEVAACVKGRCAEEVGNRIVGADAMGTCGEV